MSELSRINYPTSTQRKAHRPAKCRVCGRTVRWVEKANGWHVKLDWAPSPTGRWRINEAGIASELPPMYEGAYGMYDRHVCEVQP